MTEKEARVYIAQKTAQYESGLINLELYLSYLNSIDWNTMPTTLGYRDYLHEYVDSIIQENS
jgi:hypothetical protein